MIHDHNNLNNYCLNNSQHLELIHLRNLCSINSIMQPYFQISNILVILKRDYFEVKFEAFYKS